MSSSDHSRREAACHDYAKDTWDAMTDGMYDDDMPEDFGYDVDYESLGF